MIDAILTNTVLPAISREFLDRTMERRSNRRSSPRRGGRRLRLPVRVAAESLWRNHRPRPATRRSARRARDQLRGSARVRHPFQQSGELEKAADLYRRMLEVVPDHPGSLHYAGVLAHQQGRTDEAMAPDRAKPGGRCRTRRMATAISASCCRRLDGWTRRWRRFSARSRSTVTCERLQQSRRAAGVRRASRSKPRPRIGRRSTEPDALDAYHNLGIL